MTTNLPALADLTSLRLKNTIVTGGAKGIGAAICLRFAEAGATVVVVDLDADAVDVVVKTIESRGGRALGVVGDAGARATAERAVEVCTKTFGSVDVLVNNAGVFPSQPFLDVDDATLDKVLDLNLRGAFVFSQVAAQQMVDAGGGGSIIQVASIDALHPSGNLTAYDASKGGLLMLTKSMAKDLASHGIRVNAICPGGVSTPGVTAMVDGMAKGVPLGRMGDADDIARAAMFFASALSSWTTGAVLVVDGGTLLN